MSKRAKRLLSLLMALVMVMSLGTPAFALGGGNEIGIGGGFGRDIGDDEIREFDPTDYEAEGEDPVDFFQTTDYESGITVTVESPFNALPTKAEVRLQPVDPESVREAVESVVEGQPNILVAMDISFWLDGQEIEPDQPVNVKISAPELTDQQNLQVVHIPDADEEGAQPNTVELVTEEEMSIPVGTNEVAFKANSFSVYAVIGGTDENARLKVSFYKGETSVAEMYVKKSDTANDLKYIIYDPGVGNIGSNQVFRGWTTEKDFTVDTKPMDIDAIREMVKAQQSSIVEGETMTEIKLYALILDVFTVTYIGENNISLGTHSVYYLEQEGTEPDVKYTINMQYTPSQNTQNFEGWLVADGVSNINSAKKPDGTVIAGADIKDAADENATTLPNQTEIYIKGDVTLSVYAPQGRWLVFSENASGATYNAPLFIHQGDVTECPQNATKDYMKLAGYSFEGWYTDKNCTDGNEFVFGSTLSQNTTIYAKWVMAKTATYNIVIWKQNVTGDGYDFEEAIQETGTPGDFARNVTQDGATVVDADDSYVNFKVDGVEKDYIGFHAASYDQNVTITPQGNTVINVYYDRNKVLFTFKTMAYSAVTSPNWNSGKTYFVDYQGSKYAVGSDGYFYAPATSINRSNNYYAYLNGAWHEMTYRNNYWMHRNDDNSGWIYYGDIDTATMESEYLCDRINARSGGTYEYTEVTGNLNTNNTYWILYNGRYYELSYSSWSRNWSCGDLEWSAHNATWWRNNYGTIYQRTLVPYTFYEGEWADYKSMEGLYGSTLAENNKTWPVEYDWHAIGNDDGTTGGTHTTFLDAFLPASTNMVIDFYGVGTGGTLHIYFYKQNANGGDYTLANTVTSGGGTFFLSDKYTGFKLSKYHLEGESDIEAGPLVNDGGDLYYDTDPNTDGAQGVSYSKNLYIYFDRLSYVINYKDGTCFDGRPAKDPPVNGIGDGNVINEPKAADFGQTGLITYGADISGYGDPDNDLYKSVAPTKEGYVFCGWYSDETCQVPYEFDTMPLNGVTVYAKWHLIQYRVFLHPNAGDLAHEDPTLSWGKDSSGNEVKQETNFRIDFGGTVSAPTGTRTGYDMVGWYLDESFTKPFNADLYPLNETNVTASYDMDTDMTDPMDKWGNGATTNSDKTGYKPTAESAGEPRFWITKKLDLYLKWKAVLDHADGISVYYDPGDGTINGSSSPFVDAQLYEDNSRVSAASAATAPAVEEGKPAVKFQYWIVQKYNTETQTFEDTNTHVYPGNEFTVLASDCYVHADLEHPGKNIYEFHLVAYYDEIERVPTHITWYSNVFDAAGEAIDVNKITATKPGDNYVEANEEGKGKGFERQGVQINKGIDIPPAETFDVPGYAFLGWGRVNVDKPTSGDSGESGNDTNGVVALRTAPGVEKPEDLNGENLFLKWDGVEKVYKAQNDNDEWVTVTQVAADEQNPYHDLYAVWAPAFYVYHTGTKTVDRVILSTGGNTETEGTGTAKTFDLTELVDRKNFLYGGYYSSYTLASNGENFSTTSLKGWSTVTEASAIITENTDASQDLNGLVKDGYISTAVDEGGTKYTGQAGSFNLANAYKKGTDDPGNAIHPVAGTVYYIKEVPAGDFLQPKLRYTYRTIDGKIGASWLFTNTDDENYDFVGFMIGNSNDNTANPTDNIAAGKGIDTFMIEAYTTHNKTVFYNGETEPEHDGDDKTTYTKLYDKGLTAYLLVYYNNALYGEGNANNGPADAENVNILTEGATNQMFWVTPDGLKVTSTAFRTYRNITTTALKAEKPSENPASVISVYES